MSIKILYRDYWRDGTIIDKSGQYAQFPVEDTQVPILAQPWRDDAVTAASYASNDLLSPVPLNMFAILGHNLSAAADINFIGDNDPGYGVAPVTEPVTWNAGNIYGFFSTTQTKRYWKLQIEDVANPDGYIQVGVVKLGMAWALGRYFAPDSEIGMDVIDEPEESDSRDIFGRERPILETRSISFAGMTDVDATTFLDFQQVTGLLKPYVIVLDHTDPNGTGYYVYNTGLSVVEHKTTNFNSFGFQYKDAVQ